MAEFTIVIKKDTWTNILKDQHQSQAFQFFAGENGITDTTENDLGTHIQLTFKCHHGTWRKTREKFVFYFDKLNQTSSNKPPENENTTKQLLKRLHQKQQENRQVRIQEHQLKPQQFDTKEQKRERLQPRTRHVGAKNTILVKSTEWLEQPEVQALTNNVTLSRTAVPQNGSFICVSLGRKSDPQSQEIDLAETRDILLKMYEKYKVNEVLSIDQICVEVPQHPTNVIEEGAIKAKNKADGGMKKREVKKNTDVPITGHKKRIKKNTETIGGTEITELIYEGDGDKGEHATASPGLVDNSKDTDKAEDFPYRYVAVGFWNNIIENFEDCEMVCRVLNSRVSIYQTGEELINFRLLPLAEAKNYPKAKEKMDELYRKMCQRQKNKDEPQNASKDYYGKIILTRAQNYDSRRPNISALFPTKIMGSLPNGGDIQSALVALEADVWNFVKFKDKNVVVLEIRPFKDATLLTNWDKRVENKLSQLYAEAMNK